MSDEAATDERRYIAEAKIKNWGHRAGDVVRDAERVVYQLLDLVDEAQTTNATLRALIERCGRTLTEVSETYCSECGMCMYEDVNELCPSCVALAGEVMGRLSDIAALEGGEDFEAAIQGPTIDSRDGCGMGEYSTTIKRREAEAGE